MMFLQEQIVEYSDGSTTFKGFFAYDPTRRGPLPAIMIVHAWAGREALFDGIARKLAALGYAAFAVDMYGDGRTGSSVEENTALMTPLVKDRALLARRINAALQAVAGLPQVDGARIGAMGYCFGGLCALDLARSGADVRGVISLHGALKPSGLPAAPITAKVLVLHGHDDPLVPLDEVIAFQNEMTAAKVDWQLHSYGGTVHAFTNPHANAPEAGLLYNATADRRSWTAALNFFDEVLR
jgi:dienelactone hydrolase